MASLQLEVTFQRQKKQTSTEIKAVKALTGDRKEIKRVV